MTRRHATLAALLAAVVVLLLAAARVADGPDTQPLGPADRVVVFGVPGLTWDDIDARATPHLADAVQRGRSGLLTARGASSFSCPLDGWTTLGAGNRARYSDIGRRCAEQRANPIDPGAVANENDELAFGSEVGLLGRSVKCTSVFGNAARLAVSDGTNRADVRTKDLPRDATPESWARHWEKCPLTLISTHTLTHDDRRSAQLAHADRLVGEVLDALDRSDSTQLLIVGVSDTPGSAPTLDTAIALDSDGGSAGELRSASTGRTSYVQLIDVAPTILDVLGIEQPTAMAGRSWQATDSPASAADRIDSFRDATDKADAHRSVTSPSFWA